MGVTADCTIQTATSYNSPDMPASPVMPMMPADCCKACVSLSGCLSWTVVDFSGDGSGGVCHLKTPSGNDQQQTKDTGDKRFTSGYLSSADGPRGDDGGTNSSNVVSIVVIIISALIVSLVYFLHVTQPTKVQALQGLVVDGFIFTWLSMSRRTGRAGANEVAASATPAINPTLSPEMATGKQAKRGSAGPLHVAASLGDTVKLQKLLSNSHIDVNQGDKHCYTPFCVACSGGHAECALELIQAGCNIQLLTDTGHTGFELASELKRTSVLALHPKVNLQTHLILQNLAPAMPVASAPMASNPKVTRKKAEKLKAKKHEKRQRTKQSASAREGGDKNQGSPLAQRLTL